MSKEIIWNEDLDFAYGSAKKYNSEEEFVDDIKNGHMTMSGYECEVEDVKIQACILTCEGINAETLIPLPDTDIVIENYYTAIVETLEDAD